MRWTAAVAITGVAMGLACGGGDKNETPPPPPAPTTAPPPPPAPPPEPVKPPPPTFAEASFPCCDSGPVNGIVDNYLDFLNDINTGGGKAELTALKGFAKKCQDVLAAEDKRTCTSIEALTDDMRKSNSEMHAKTPELGMRVMEIVKRHKGSGKLTLAVAHCDKNDGYWIQRTETLKSPFAAPYADCGEFIKLE
jgi:hypothetical protein